MTANILREGIVEAKGWKAPLFFTLALVVFENCVFSIYGRYVGNLLSPTYSALIIAIGIALSFAWLCIFIWASAHAGKICKAFYFLIFALVSLAQYSYQNAVGHYLTPEDLALGIWQTDITLKWRMGRSYINWMALIPISAYAGFLAIQRNAPKTGWKTFLAVLLSCFGFYSGAALLTQANFSTTSLNAFAYTLANLIWNPSSTYNGPREEVMYRASSAPVNNVVLVIDESVKAEHLSLNGYERQTTPYLDELGRTGKLTNWGVAVAGANSSLPSNNLLWTGFSPAKLPDLNNQIRRMPTFFQYAKAMGYKTHYFDAQLTTRWVGTDYDSNYIDDLRLAERFQSPNDFSLARVVGDIIDRSAGNFIVVNKQGVHFPYFANLPEKEVMWSPWQKTYMPQKQIPREELINTYDSALKYNLEGFFRLLNIPHRKYDTVLIYTSDHGQNLCEHGESASHASEYCNGREKLNSEVTVPLFMLTTHLKALDTKGQKNEMGHHNIFAALLDLMKFPRSEVRQSYGQSLLSSDPIKFAPRYYFAGYKLNRRWVTEGTLCFDCTPVKTDAGE